MSPRADGLLPTPYPPLLRLRAVSFCRSVGGPDPRVAESASSLASLVGDSLIRPM